MIEETGFIFLDHGVNGTFNIPPIFQSIFPEYISDAGF
jgi:hypothetical protein